MSVFDMLRSRSSSHASNRHPDDLSPGVAYECYKFTLRLSDFENKKTKEKPMCLMAYVQDPSSSNKYYIVMPTMYNNLEESHVEQLNESIKNKKAPFIVYYGKDKNRNDLILHEHGESIDQKKLEFYANKDKEEPAPKRKKTELDDSSLSS